MVKTILGGLLVLGLVTTTSQGIELKMKYEPGQDRVMNIEMDIKGDIDISGAVPIKGSGEGQIGTKMNLKVLSVDADGVATIEQSVDDIRIDFKAEAETPEGPKKWSVELTPEGGTLVAEGQTTPIPADSLKDIQSQSWKIKLNEQGAPVGMDIDASEMSEEEAENVQNMSESISNMIGKAALMPEGDVEEGHKWEEVLSVDEITKELVKDNPMLSVMAQMGIPDLTTNYQLDEVSESSGKQIATISSKTLFDWSEGNLPLGVVNVTINNLKIKGNTLTTMDVTEGYTSRQTSDTTLEYDLTINTVFGPDGPATYEAKGSLTINTSVKTN